VTTTRAPLPRRALLRGLLLTLVAGCATQAPAAAPHTLLNSERIAQRFGSYGVEVLDSDGQLRVSNLYSGAGDQRICRTFAVVVFEPALDPRVATEHQTILAGGSIGAVFKSRGWAVDKRHRLLAEIPAPLNSDRLTGLMHLANPRPLAIDVYELVVSRGDVSVDYATIAEVYHPDYLNVGDLRALYGSHVPSAAGEDRELVGLLDVVAGATREAVSSAETVCQPIAAPRGSSR
jgi:hypothetical protein